MAPDATAGVGPRIQRALAGALDALPDSTKVRLAGGRPVVVDDQQLDAGIQLALRVAALRGSSSFIHPRAEDPVAERRRIRADAAVAQGPLAPVGAVRELKVPGGRTAIRARHYAPPERGDEQARPLLVYAHGGGWVVGDLDTHDAPCRLLCRHARVHVLSLEYGLAPEHPFPQGLGDVVAAVRWAVAEAASLGADPARVAVGGDSAGGNLVAVACQRLVVEGGPLPALQVLIYPAVDCAGETRSEELFAEGFYLDRRSRRWCDERYLIGVGREDPRVSPLRGELSGLPAALVVSAGFDLLRDEGEAYAAALRGAGVPVVVHRAATMIHGFLNWTGISRGARDEAMLLAGLLAALL